jgi:hypothetical protein
MYSLQLKPAEMRSYPNIAIRPWLDTKGGNQTYWIVLSPDKSGQQTNLQGSLDLYERTNHLVECPVAGIILSDAFGKDWGAGTRRALCCHDEQVLQTVERGEALHFYVGDKYFGGVAVQPV